MYLRQRSNVDEGTKVPSRPLPGRPEHTSLIESPEKTNAKSSEPPEPGNNPGQEMDPSPGIEGVYIISVAARILDMHPQTLRKYERIGLVRPSRTVGSMRIYSQREIARLRMIKRLAGDLGINLAGVQQLLSIAEIIEKVRPLVANESIARPERRRQVAGGLDRSSQLLGL